MRDPLRYHRPHAHLSATFGSDRFGQMAETFARFFGTAGFIAGQTALIVLWVIANGLWMTKGAHWDPYPFILLNLLFSTQAAYAAPLILLAQTRQAERDKAHAEADARHREELHGQLVQLIDANTALTEQIHELVDK